MRVDEAVAVIAMTRKWTQEQVTRARRLCYRTIWTESDWRNLANKNVPGSIAIQPNDGYPSHGGDLDSLGLFQQRVKYYPDMEADMDPYRAALQFLIELARIPDWQFLDEPDACQRVQRSSYNGTGLPYAANYAARSAQTDAVEADLLYFEHTAPVPTA